jgi:hypothetical protein
MCTVHNQPEPHLIRGNDNRGKLSDYDLPETFKHSLFEVLDMALRRRPGWVKVTAHGVPWKLWIQVPLTMPHPLLPNQVLAICVIGLHCGEAESQS